MSKQIIEVENIKSLNKNKVYVVEVPPQISAADRTLLEHMFDRRRIQVIILPFSIKFAELTTDSVYLELKIGPKK